MAGTKFITCPVCFEKSRRARGWYCPHCDHMRPPELTKPLPVMAEKPKELSYKQWLAENRRGLDDPKAWTDYCLNQMGVLPK